MSLRDLRWKKIGEVLCGTKSSRSYVIAEKAAIAGRILPRVLRIYKLVTATRPFADCYLQLIHMSTDNIDLYSLELDLELHHDREKRLNASKTKVQELLPAARKNVPIAVVTPVRRKPGTEGNPIIIEELREIPLLSKELREIPLLSKEQKETPLLTVKHARERLPSRCR